jgi:hypothetical protein
MGCNTKMAAKILLTFGIGTRNSVQEINANKELNTNYAHIVHLQAALFFSKCVN